LVYTPNTKDYKRVDGTDFLDCPLPELE
jgi:hypothetical protein